MGIVAASRTMVEKIGHRHTGVVTVFAGTTSGAASGLMSTFIRASTDAIVHPRMHFFSGHLPCVLGSPSSHGSLPWLQ